MFIKLKLCIDEWTDIYVQTVLPQMFAGIKVCDFHVNKCLCGLMFVMQAFIHGSLQLISIYN